MLKQALIFVGLVALVSMLALSFITAKYIDRVEIARVENEKRELQDDRQELLKKVSALTEAQQKLEVQVKGLNEQIGARETRIKELEKARAEAQLTVRKLDQPDQLKAKLKETFPEMAASQWGVTRLHDEQNNVDIDYLVVPLWFSETFVIDHQNSLSYQAQLDLSKEVSALKSNVITLTNQNLALEKEKSSAFEAGYNKAFTLYMDLNDKYTTLLKQPPKVEFKPPGLVSTLGGLAAGLILGAKL